MIKAREICLTYTDGTEALKNIELQVGPGELIYITGPSGSGKTSLLKLLMGVEFATSGTLEVLGLPMVKGKPAGLRKLRMALGPVFQEFRLIKGRTAMENVMLGMRFLNFYPDQLKANSLNALIEVGLEHKAFSLVENLSWGECQRVAIARIVARKPALILADEPTGNLDKDNAVSILELLNSFKSEKTSVIITTHATHLIEGMKGIKHMKMNKGSMSWERLG